MRYLAVNDAAALAASVPAVVWMQYP